MPAVLERTIDRLTTPTAPTMRGEPAASGRGPTLRGLMPTLEMFRDQRSAVETEAPPKTEEPQTPSGSPTPEPTPEPSPSRALLAEAEMEMRAADAAMKYFYAAGLGTSFNPTTIAARASYYEAGERYFAAQERYTALSRTFAR